ncbi:MAG: GTP-binding protein [Deltaproteobacteria bacterium]|nr:GTP-binding protein [Deltaproteobacteria bacterium]
MPKHVSTVEMSEAKKRIRVDEAIQISDLAHQMGVKASKVMRALWTMGMRNLTINHAVDVETAELVAAEFGYSVENVSFQEDEFISDYDEDEGELRAPVVTIMGHVDHGKTTLLDYIRKAKVAEGEAGGITQHIGAYRVETGQGPVVFIDTPGHEAFTAMRSRGAAVTDIIVLIVAADDGVMPTTREAIKIANEADVPIIVAVNKIDKPDANIGRVEQMLMKEGLVGEAYGGETVICHISAKSGTGVEELLELLAVQAEVLELRAPIDGPAYGTVIESRIDKGRGSVATLLVQSGTLQKGDIVVANEYSGKVRDIFTPSGKKIDEATPSTPIESWASMARRRPASAST